MGKSVFLALITAFLGEVNSSSKTLQQLTENRFATAALFAKLANIFADLDNTRLKDIGIFKTVVSGDWIDAELKFRNSFTFKPFAKLIFSANLPPLPPQGISDEDAYYRRWIVVPFNRRKKCFFCGKDIVKNPNLLDELTTEDELSGLAYLAVKAVQRLIAKHRFSKNPSIEQVADEYQKKANPVKAWVNARCVIQGDYETAKDRLEQDFIEYCQRKDLPTVDRASLGRELKNLYGCEDARRGPNKNQNRVWTKIALRKDLIAKGQSDLFMIGGADVEELDD
jgi:putative DNA primase/helicase